MNVKGTEFNITKHATLRAKQRLGLNKSQLFCHIKNLSNINPLGSRDARRELKKLNKRIKKNTTVYLFNNVLYIFRDNLLITLFPLSKDIEMSKIIESKFVKPKLYTIEEARRNVNSFIDAQYESIISKIQKDYIFTDYLSLEKLKPLLEREYSESSINNIINIRIRKMTINFDLKKKDIPFTHSVNTFLSNRIELKNKKFKTKFKYLKLTI